VAPWPPSPADESEQVWYLVFDINSGYTVRDGEWSVGEWGVVRGQWGNVELLTLTLSFPSNRKRYETGINY
jgi:hypothetical protein